MDELTVEVLCKPLLSYICSDYCFDTHNIHGEHL